MVNKEIPPTSQEEKVNLPIDPEAVPVRIIDRVVNFGILGTTINMTLATNRMAIVGGGRIQNEFIIAARLRFDPRIGRIIRDAINSQLKLIETPKGNAN